MALISWSPCPIITQPNPNKYETHKYVQRILLTVTLYNRSKFRENENLIFRWYIKYKDLKRGDHEGKTST